MRGRPKSSDRLWTRECAVLDIANVPRRELAEKYSQWNPYASVKTTWLDGDWRSERIKITTTRPHFGGLRYWFACPACERRRCKLYATEEDRCYVCRVCRKLVYASQYQKHPLLVLLRRMDSWMEASSASRRRWNTKFARYWEEKNLSLAEVEEFHSSFRKLPKGY